jgi:hypothetical protein
MSEQEQPQPSEEELRAALEQELKRVRIEQVVLESAVSLLNLSIRRAGLVEGSEDERDLDQTAIGIEAVRALMPLVDQLAGEQAKAIRDALSQLQLAYVRARESAGSAPAPGGAGEDGSTPPGEPGAAAKAAPAGDEGGAGPAQSSGRLWVPGQ